MHPWSAEETSFKNACETHTHIQYIYIYTVGSVVHILFRSGKIHSGFRILKHLLFWHYISY